MFLISSLLFIYIFLDFVNAITLNAITFSYIVEENVYNDLIDDFNEYSKKNDLNIHIELEILTPFNSTSEVTDYGSTIESLLNKKSKKHDLFFYDNIYSNKLGIHFLNLDDILSKEHIDDYNYDIISKSCSYKNNLISLPIYLDYSVLYSNTKLMKKYHKPIPKTWNDLIDTTKHIMNEEKKKDSNTDLVSYVGLFDNNEIGTCSLYEFIYSCRNELNETFPELTSETTVKSLELLKHIKDEIGSDSLFGKSDGYALDKINNGTALFIKYWNFGYSPFYHVSPLPGIKEGISGTVVGGYNLGINKYIIEEKLKAAIIAFKHITSKEIQKKIVVMNHHLFSAIPSLYGDMTVCEVVDCGFFKSIQPIVRPISVIKDYDTYSIHFRNYIYEYLYDNKISAREALKKINDITRFYEITIKTDDSVVGLILFIVPLIFIIIMLVSLVLLRYLKLRKYFSFLPIDFWVLTIIGNIMMMCIGYFGYGTLSPLKCQFKLLFFSLGLCFNYVPILYKLIVDFPIINKKSLWVEKHRYVFFLFFILLDILFNSISIGLSSYRVDNIESLIYPSFKVCKVNYNMNSFIVGVIHVYKVLLLLAMEVLVFLEWNLLIMGYDVRLISTLLITDIFYIIFFIIFYYIKFENYLIYFAMNQSFYIIFSLSNYMIFYGIRMILIILQKNNLTTILSLDFNSKPESDEKNVTFMKNSNPNESNNTNSYSDDDCQNSKLNNSFFGLNTLIQCHYREVKSNNKTSCDIFNVESTQGKTSEVNYSFDMSRI